MIALGVHRVVVRSQGPDVAEWNKWWHRFEDRFLDPDEEDAVLAFDYTAASGQDTFVATYAEPFELRKMQVSWNVQDAVAATDDVRVATLHLAKVSGGAVSADWLAADFTNATDNFIAFWDAIKERFHAYTKLKEIKFYKAGPAIAPPQPPVYDLDLDNAGTASENPLPPQVAVTVTEIAGTKPHWGRFYLPAPHQIAANIYGRLALAVQTDFADAADAMYTAMVADNIPIVVYRAPLPIREKKNGTELPARAGSAWTVDTIQVDDVFDVIRSRRWKYPQLRLQRGI